MARSSYIYIANGKDRPLAAFTVKYELEAWLDRRRQNTDEGNKVYDIYRYSHYGEEMVDVTDQMINHEPNN